MSEGAALVELAALMRRLRAECAWKSAQTHQSLLPFLAEEAAEVAEAVVEGDPDHLREELGDLLLQVCFHAAIAEEAGLFTLDDVARGLIEKMHRRNPHVFDPASLGRSPGDPPLTADEVEVIWAEAKRRERR